MKWRIIMVAKIYTRLLVFILFFNVHIKVHAWELDFSRRNTETQKSNSLSQEVVPLSENIALPMDPKNLETGAGESQNASNYKVKNNDNLFSKVFSQITDPAQTIVILNTDQGFVPDTLRLRKGANYRIYVVNTNEAQKNLSFSLDAFSEHHSTYFGKNKSFDLSPKVEGIFSFQCPETAKQGKVVVYDDRSPASH